VREKALLRFVIFSAVLSSMHRDIEKMTRSKERASIVESVSFKIGGFKPKIHG
jgi:hypothetical protein